MDFTRATILLTGGNSGIGRGLAEALAARGSKLIITGRSPQSLKDTLDANSGMVGYELDVTDPEAIRNFAVKLVREHPEVAAVIHNAGIMVYEKLIADRIDLDAPERTIATNLLGPIRLTTALLPHLRSKPSSAVVTVTSGLAFVPRADAPTYSATKAALHAWTQCIRHQLRDTSVDVVEIAPPLVATELTPGQSKLPHAMPLEDFVREAIDLLCTEPTPGEVLVQRVMPQRTAEQTGNFKRVFDLINPAA